MVAFWSPLNHLLNDILSMNFWCHQMPSTSDEITPRWFRITIIPCTISPDEKLNVPENVKSFWYFPKNKQKHHGRTMASTITTITSSSKQYLNHNFLPRTVHKRFSDLVPKNSGDRGITTFKDSHAWANSAGNSITSKWRHNDKNFNFHNFYLNFPNSADYFLIFDADLVQFWNRTVFI